MTSLSAGEKADKYEQLLAKIDWHAERPPRGYQYGVGRGARAFTTTAELSIGVAAALKNTTEENDFFSALDRIESRRAKKAVPSAAEEEDVVAPPTATTKLSMDDLSTIGLGLAGASLTTRSARTDAADTAEEHFFSDERGVTVHDLLRGKTLASEHNLQNILEMGSPEEQTTWITHARAYREMGMAKKAHQTLVDGCKMTGSQGSMIWEERLSFIAADNHAAHRRVLEEAVEACPQEEGLWLRLLQYQPPHEQLTWLQRGVIACPASEKLWVRVVESVPSVADQKKIIRRALQRTPNLPLLWSKLARLEGYQVGREVFRAAAQKYPSFALVVEAAAFSEWCMQTADPSQVPTMKKELEVLVRTAADQYLRISEESSRRQWLEKAQELCTDDQQVSIWTSANMYVCFASVGSSASAVLQDLWMHDLLAVLEKPWEQHGVLCSMWAAWLLVNNNRNNTREISKDTTTAAAMELIVDVVRSAVETASEATLQQAVERHLMSQIPMATQPAEEEEEEELGHLAPVPPVTTPQHTVGAATAGASSPLEVVLSHTLLSASLLGTPKFAVSLAKVLYNRKLYKGALRVLQLAEPHQHQSQERAVIACAMAKSYAAIGAGDDADLCLVRATSGADYEDADDLPWVKLAVHRRSRKQDISALLSSGLQRHPRSVRLWLMRLQAIRQGIAMAKAAGDIPHALVKEARRAYEQALDAEHCRSSAAVWIYAAVRIESDTLFSAATARALLLDAAIACAVRHTSAASASQQQAEVTAALGMAKARVERLHAGDGPALEVVQETLQKLPKTREGTFTVPVGELLQWFIDLEVPAGRGRAAAQVMRNWKSREPLALLAVAKLYHAAGSHAKALDQAVKAVEAGAGRCGDAVAYLWHLAQQQAYKVPVGHKMGVRPETLEEHVAAVPLDAEDVRKWVVKTTITAMAAETHNSNRSAESDSFPVPHSGPQWISVAKEEDPSNVTLLGYRDSVEGMLVRVMDKL